MESMEGESLKMGIFEEPNMTSGIDELLLSTADAVSIFPSMLLTFVFFLIFLGGSSNQKRRSGEGDYPFWAVLSGVGTTMMALVMSLMSLIDITVLVIVISITLLCAVWFFLSKNKGDL